MRPAFLLLLLLVLSACASGPGIPDTTYFRLPPRAAVESGPASLDSPLVIEPFFADGVHSDQALLYSTDPDGERLRAYHYQMWIDPPTRLLQRRLIRMLDEAGVAPLVIERLLPRNTQYRLLARIDAFERLRRGEQWVVRAHLQIRLDHSDGALPLLLRDYRREVPADGTSVRDSVRALGTAVDAIYAELLGDLRALPGA